MVIMEEEIIFLTLNMARSGINIPGHHFSETLMQVRTFTSTIKTKITFFSSFFFNFCTKSTRKAFIFEYIYPARFYNRFFS